ncbi:MAG: hypothetical protein IKI63_03670 [Clostridia bacterium]|nr:hypothetical protein [Clostridia bacterium]
MADNKRSADACPDAVCIDAGRVYDSCADKDCHEDLRVYFCERDQQLINNAAVARVRKAELLTTCIDVEALPFNRGFYACDLTFYFEITAEACGGRGQPPYTVCGVASCTKKVILYGSEGNVKVFSSEFTDNAFDRQEMPSLSLPRCVVQVAEPVVLDAQLKNACECACTLTCDHLPETLRCRFGTDLTPGGDRVLTVTLGLFSIVQMVRNVQMLVPVYDFCMPSKECCPTGDSPCDAFRHMGFPVDEFFPPKQSGSGCGCGYDNGCGCG